MIPCLATSIMPLLIAAPANTPIAATVTIVLCLATLAPMAEFRKFTASLLTPTTRSKTARIIRNTTIPRNRMFMCLVYYSLSVDATIISKYISTKVNARRITNTSQSTNLLLLLSLFTLSVFRIRGKGTHLKLQACCGCITKALQCYPPSVNLTVSPPPCVGSAVMVPPRATTVFLTMARPRPVPPSLRDRPLSTR